MANFTFMWPCIVTNFLVIKPTRRTAFEQDQDGTCSKAVYIPAWYMPLLSAQWITLDDGQRNSPKHVDFHFQNKFERLVHLVGFITRKYLWHLMQVLVLFDLHVPYKELKKFHCFLNVNITKDHTAWSVLSKFGITVVKVILYLHCEFFL
jgi:hypothetical protein